MRDQRRTPDPLRERVERLLVLDMAPALYERETRDRDELLHTNFSARASWDLPAITGAPRLPKQGGEVWLRADEGEADALAAKAKRAEEVASAKKRAAAEEAA